MSPPDDFPNFSEDAPKPRVKTPPRPKEIVITIKSVEVMPGLLVACRIALGLCGLIYSIRLLSSPWRQHPLLSFGVQLELALYTYSALLGAWLGIEAVSELHRCRKMLAAKNDKSQ